MIEITSFYILIQSCFLSLHRGHVKVIKGSQSVAYTFRAESCYVVGTCVKMETFTLITFHGSYGGFFIPDWWQVKKNMNYIFVCLFKPPKEKSVDMLCLVRDHVRIFPQLCPEYSHHQDFLCRQREIYQERRTQIESETHSEIILFLQINLCSNYVSAVQYSKEIQGT